MRINIIKRTSLKMLCLFRFIRKMLAAKDSFFTLIIISMRQLTKTSLLRYFSIHLKYKSELEKHYKQNQLLPGFCNEQKSLIYARRNPKVHQDNWRTPVGIPDRMHLSNLGIGTYTGQPSNEHDYEMFRALVDTILTGGVNIIDSCALYRFGKSQKCINAALNYLIQEQGYDREQFFVSTKCGYIPHDIDSELKEKDYMKILTDNKVVEPSEFVHDIHCIDPNFLDFSVDKSRLGLGLETIDLVYLNNFSEAHLPVVGEELTYSRLKKAFQKFEQMRIQKKIRYYGLCSYVGLRSPQTETGVHFQLQRAINLAKQVGGDNHGFRFIMIPFSLGTPEALLKWQDYNDGKQTKAVRVFDIAEKENINIVTCSPLFQGRIANLPFQNKKLDFLSNHSAKHLHLIRSFPSSVLLSTMVGQTQDEHIKQNMQILEHPRLSAKEWTQILPIPE